MIFRNKRFLVGGMLSIHTKDAIKAEAEWFDVDCVRLVDSVMLMFPYMQKLEEDEADNLLDYLFEKGNAEKLPSPHTNWHESQHPVLRVYYYIMKSINRESPIRYLRSKIKIDGKHVVVVDSDGQGFNW